MAAKKKPRPARLKRPRTKKLTIVVDATFHADLKAEAARARLSIADLVQQALGLLSDQPKLDFVTTAAKQQKLGVWDFLVLRGGIAEGDIKVTGTWDVKDGVAAHTPGPPPYGVVAEDMEKCTGSDPTSCHAVEVSSGRR